MEGLILPLTGSTIKADDSGGSCSCGGICIWVIQGWYESNPKK